MAELHTGFDCRVCGEHHATLPFSFSVKAPFATAAVPVAEWPGRVVHTPEQCIVDGRAFFLRSRIVVPVHELGEPFIWGVWVEISPRAFLRANDTWRTPGRETEPPFDGWLNTRIPLFGETLNLPVKVHTQPVGRRPQLQILDPGHPLAEEASRGISLRRVEEIAEALLHAPSSLSAGETP